MARFDAIVLGLGAMGSAATYQLARHGANVLGIDRFSPPHAFGSTHGDTRVTRLAIGEGEHLTPLAVRSHEIWRAIERETGERLLTTNGGLVISSEGPTAVTHVEGFFANTVAAAQRFSIAHELLDAAAIRKRFPRFKVRDNEVGYFERDAGFVRPEACIRAQLALARRHGAELRSGERVLSFEESSSGVTVATEKGSHSADRLIVAAGPWLSQLLTGSQTNLFRIYRQVLFWFDIEEPDTFAPERFPIFIWELQGANQGIYGFPAIDGRQGGMKVATEQYAATTTPDTVSREVSAREISGMYDAYVAPNLSGVRPSCIKAVVCLYTVTPDFGFVIDWLPGSKRIVVASPCSGHGFKHSAAIGEVLADLAMGGTSGFDLHPFRFARFERG